MTPVVVVTMAGLGSRFRNAGYTVPKYQVRVRSKTLFSWSLESLRCFLDAGADLVFVALEQDDAGAFIEQECRELGVHGHALVELERLTDGQATSALLGLEGARPDRPLLVWNIDTYVTPPAFGCVDLRGDGWIPCFPGAGEAWSFVRADPQGRVLEVREKCRISPHATLGLYGFGSVESFRTVYEQHYADPANVERGERYIAPMYNTLVAADAEVWMTEVDPVAVHPLGTPTEVEAFAETDRNAPAAR